MVIYSIQCEGFIPEGLRADAGRRMKENIVDEIDAGAGSVGGSKKVKRNHKDSLFGAYFKNPAILLDVLSAIDEESYPAGSEVVINTLENVLFKGMVTACVQYQSRTKSGDACTKQATERLQHFSSHVARRNEKGRKT
jgi:hypothetical protein